MNYLKKEQQEHPDNLLQLNPKITQDIFVEGEILEKDMRSVAVIGTRKPTLYGIEMTRIITKEAVLRNYTIVSGMARGVDTEAHRMALESGGRTIAVLGTGLDVIYPEENIGLAASIIKNGALLSQFTPGTPPLKKNFPIRNGVVALLSQKLVLIESPLKSGALITARLSAESGKQVYVLPGRIGEENMQGNYSFYRKYGNLPNVHLITAIEDVFSGEGIQSRFFEQDDEKRIDEKFDENEKMIINILHSENKGLFFDVISERSGLTPEELPAVLLNLIMEDVIIEYPGKIYKMKRG